MKHIYIYSPSGAVRDLAAFRRGVKRLREIGYGVEIDRDALRSHTRFAGDDQVRLAAIERAASSGADVALISRGGYGLTRLLPQLPFDKLQSAIERGTRFVGLSDFTALQAAVLAETKGVTWAGPALGEDFGPEADPDEVMLACFDDLVARQSEGTGWRILRRHWTGGDRASVCDDGVRGTLWGGNLAVLVSLLGTPYFPQVRGGILFLEDVAEYPWRIERMLTQLLNAGVLASQKAILLGGFTGYTATTHDRGFKLRTVIEWVQSQIKAPIIEGLPFGHVPRKVLLPYGAKTTLIRQDQEFLLLW